MECPYCKEEIKQGAKKCKVCGELLGSGGRLKSLTSVLSGLLSILIPVGSLSIALLEHQGRVQADKQKMIVEQEKVIVEQEAERDKKANEDILRQIDPDFISRQAARELKPTGEPEFEDVPPDEESQRTVEQIKKFVSDGNKALVQGDTNKAERLYRKAETIEKESPQVQQITKQYVPKSLGYVYLQKGKFQEAIKEFKKALERDPEDIEARKGLIYAQTLARKKTR